MTVGLGSSLQASMNCGRLVSGYFECWRRKINVRCLFSLDTFRGARSENHCSDNFFIFLLIPVRFISVLSQFYFGLNTHLPRGFYFQIVVFKTNFMSSSASRGNRSPAIGYLRMRVLGWYSCHLESILNISLLHYTTFI